MARTIDRSAFGLGTRKPRHSAREFWECRILVRCVLIAVAVLSVNVGAAVASGAAKTKSSEGTKQWTQYSSSRSPGAEGHSKSNSGLTSKVVRIRRGYKVKGYFYPVTTYPIKGGKHHGHRPSSSYSNYDSVANPHEMYEYQYVYDIKPKPHYYHHYHSQGDKKGLKAGLMLAALPLLLIPLLSMMYTPLMLAPTMTTSISAGKKRKKRQVPLEDNNSVDQDDFTSGPPRPYQVIANYLRKIHYDEKARNRAMYNYLHCEGLLDRYNHCFERLACEFTDVTNSNARQLDKAVTSILLGHVLKNEFIPRLFKKRLKAAAVFGKKHRGKCSRYYCDKIRDRGPALPRRRRAHGHQQLAAT